MKTGNEIIAEYMGYLISDGNDGVYHKGTFYHPTSLKWYSLTEMDYHEKIEWLYPVYLQVRKELIEFDAKVSFDSADEYFIAVNAKRNRESIEVALIQGGIAELHKEIVKGIQFITENKK